MSRPDDTLRAVSVRKGWLDDPRLARRLSRVSWVVLVTVFVVLTQADLGEAAQRFVLALLLGTVAVLNAPVGVGLWGSRAEAHTPLFRLVAFALMVRIAATLWVVWSLTP